MPDRQLTPLRRSTAASTLPDAVATGAAAGVFEALRTGADPSSDSDDLLGTVDADLRHLVESGSANVLRALDLAPDFVALEFRAGAGGRARYLAENVAVVDVLEPDPGWAAVARERLAALPNARVVPAGVEALPRVAAYDLVVAVQGADDAELVALATSLRPGGVLVVVDDNPLGLPALAGASPRRGRDVAEWERLVHDLGLPARRLAVFPDGDVVRVVVDTEALTRTAPDLLLNLPRFPSPRHDARTGSLRERDLWERSVANEVAGLHANAFLMLLGDGASSVWPAGRLAAYFALDRRAGFAVKTIVDDTGGDPVLIRSAIGTVEPPLALDDEPQPFVPGIPFLAAFLDADAAGRAAHLRAARELLEAERDDRGYLVDLLPRNIVVTADRLVAIDREFRIDDVDAAWRRGLLWLAIDSFHAGAVDGVPTGTVRDLLHQIGTAAGMPDDGWVATAIAEEARFQSTVTTLFPGEDGEARWREELVTLLDVDLDAESALPGLEDVPDEVGPLREAYRELFVEHTELQTTYDEVQDALRQRIVAHDALLSAHREVRGELREFAERSTQVTAEMERLRAETAGVLGELEAFRADAQSRASRAVRAARRLVGKVAPGGTHRRGVYERTLRLAATVLRRGRRRTALAEVVAVPPAIVFPEAVSPVASIVIPIHGSWDYTERCLRSLSMHLGDLDVEVVIVDDASPDDSLARLAVVGGIRVVALAENVGFTRAANAGIAAARGRHVVMLNNDTEVTEGWLEALLDAADDPSAGVVGAKLVYPDRRLQEAGGIVFENAAGWNYGRYDDPELPVYNYRRRVDYCSGAALLITRRLLDLVPGFDERYAPAYYEDTDLAFEARRHGFEAIYEPGSVVIHHEGVSHGTDENAGLKQYQVVNREKFAAKWATELEGQFPHDLAGLGTIAVPALRRGRGTVVIVDHMVPRWDEDSGSLRMRRIIDNLLELGYDIVFFPDDRHPAQPFTRELQKLGVLVWYGWGDVHEHLRQIAAEIAFVLVARQPVAMSHLHRLRTALPGIPVAFDTVDLHFLREERGAELHRASAGGASVTRELELALMRAADATLVVSEIEQRLLAELVPEARVFVVSNVHDAEATGDPDSRREITFVGSFQHPPNADAVAWFLREVMPLVVERVGDVPVTIVGRNPPPDLTDLASESVVFTDWVEDLEPIHARSRIGIAPLRYGAGVKGKVGDAWAHGVPVVMTSIAAEGMFVEPGVTAFVADDPAEFADGIVRLLQDSDEWTRMSREVRSHVAKHFGSERLRDALENLIGYLALRPRPENVELALE